MPDPVIIGSSILGAAGIGAFSASEAQKSAEEQAEEQRAAYERQASPQLEYLKQLYPMNIEMMQEYLPYYKSVLAQQKEMLPYGKQMFQEHFLPMYQKTYQDILGYEQPGIQPWERQAVGLPYSQARTRLGERAAGMGTLRAGPTQKLATLYDIAEAEALTKLPYQRQQAEKEKKLQAMMQFLGFQPSMPSVSAPGQIGTSIPAYPTSAAYQGQGIDTETIGTLLGYMDKIGKTTTTSTPYTGANYFDLYGTQNPFSSYSLPNVDQYMGLSDANLLPSGSNYSWVR